MFLCDPSHQNGDRCQVNQQINHYIGQRPVPVHGAPDYGHLASLNRALSVDMTKVLKEKKSRKEKYYLKIYKAEDNKHFTITW